MRCWSPRALVPPPEPPSQVSKTHLLGIRWLLNLYSHSCFSVYLSHVWPISKYTFQSTYLIISSQYACISGILIALRIKFKPLLRPPGTTRFPRLLQPCFSPPAGALSALAQRPASLIPATRLCSLLGSLWCLFQFLVFKEPVWFPNKVRTSYLTASFYKLVSSQHCSNYPLSCTEAIIWLLTFTLDLKFHGSLSIIESPELSSV